MAKRKSTMKNIIYELDNDDIEISSDDEVSGPKVTRTEPKTDDKVKEVITETDQNGVEVLSVDSTDDSVCVVDSPKRTVNGGKTSSDVGENLRSAKSLIVESNFQDETEIVCVTKTNSDCENSTIFDEDIVVDSPSDLCVAGCENRMPLVTIRFNNSKLSSSCREKIKKFMINLIKEHQKDNDTNSDNETDYELDIWPDDLVDVAAEEEKQDVDDDLFFVDTAPGDERNIVADIPKYSQVSSTICNKTEKEKSPPPFFRRGPMCFNCDGAHQLKDCTRPRDNIKIAKMVEQKRNTSHPRVGRYHVEDDQKYGHLIPGRISGQLRHALGLKRDELPLFIYRMRLLGYPPGWLEEARISHSGITLFDSTGSATLDPEEEEGEICEAGSKDKYDIKKILDFPGFNVPASSRYSEEAHLYGLPPMSEQDSKIAMLQMLAPNAMKAYKRKKLTFFPSAPNSSAQEGLAEMELDSGDEEAVFPLVPPLPDEAPPPLPPPPEQPPPPPEDPPLPPKDSERKDEEKKKEKGENTKKDTNNDSDVIEIIQDSDALEVPLPDDSFITIDEDYEDEKPADRSSPSIDDLEKQKEALMEALEKQKQAVMGALHNPDVPNTEGNENIKELTDTKEQKTEVQKGDDKLEESQKDKPVKSPVIKKDASSPAGKDKVSEDKSENNDKGESMGTPEPKSGKVKTTSYGTPVLNIASPFMKLPSDDKFSKDICDVINFDNLPNSIGKYKQISNLLKKVKTEVDRIHES